MIIEKDFVPYNEALALKELEFDEPCIQQYSYDGAIMFCVNSWGQPRFKTNKESLSDSGGDCISAPTFSQAFRFFREKYDLQYTITWNKHYSKNPYQWEVRKSWRDEPIIPYGIGGMSETYEQAELECLRKLIELCKSK